MGVADVVVRGYRFQLRPTVGQAQAMAAMLEDHRELYNAALQERRDAYRSHGVAVRYGEQSAQLREIRAVRPDQGRWCRWDSAPESGQVRVRLQGVGHVKVNRHRKVEGRVKTVTVKREGRRWFVILACEVQRPVPLPRTGRQVGIDVGVASLLTTSDGEHVQNPRHAAKAAARLATAQQALSRCKRSSKRRGKARERVAAVHGKVRRQRLDHAHKTALDLVRAYDVIAHEDLVIRNMVRAPAPKPDPATPGGFLPNGRAAKAGLSRSIQDAGWGVLLSILAYKAASAGRVMVAVDPRNTSRTCPREDCGHVAEENRATQALSRCVGCGDIEHADVVGALNVLRAGLARRDTAPTAA
jgi:putative transposase